MTVGYAVLEEAVRQQIISTLPEFLTNETCVISDIDKLLEVIFTTNGRFGCVLDYNGGEETVRQPMSHAVWSWSILGMFLIKLSDSIDSDLRDIIGLLHTTFSSGNHTLGGLTPKAMFTDIGRPERGAVNDTPFYWLPFIVEVIDR